MTECRLLICTVGGTPEAVIAAIKGSQAEKVIFITSPETRGDVKAQVIPALTNEGVALREAQYDYFQVPDAQDFTGCVERLRELGEQVDQWRARGIDHTVIVDFTGGTKCMSASLALVARQWHCGFSYIGGEQRNKGGVGVVVSGKEKIMHFQNPWDALGYQAVEDAALLFDQGNYEAAEQILERALPVVHRPDVKLELNTFRSLCQAYLEWDRFQHKKADSVLAEVQKNANHLRHLFPNSAPDVLEKVTLHRRFLQDMLKSRVSRFTLVDLCANARRCASKGRYDDAVARLYRVVEASAQFKLHAKYGLYCCDAGMPDFSKLDLRKVPEPLRKEWSPRCREDGTISLGLQDNYRLLALLKDELAVRFEEFRVKENLSARNRSILAHGFEPVGEKVFNDLWQKTMALVEVKEDELPAFPCLRSSVRKNDSVGQKRAEQGTQKGGARKTYSESGVAEGKE